MQVQAPQVQVMFQKNFLMLREVQMKQLEAQLAHDSYLLPEMDHVSTH